MASVLRTLVQLCALCAIYTQYADCEAITSPALPAFDKARKPLVHIPRYGWLSGRTYSNSTNQRTYYGFLGVKYAESPSGTHRFKAPVPVQPWRGIRSAENFGPNCPTIDGINTVKADIANGVDVEDCLVMNIYTPSINLLMPKKLYPVMVFIHGGTFSSFTGSDFRSDYILGRKDVVLVVPNYREAALGFLSTMTNEVPGNAGALDALLALQWVKDNIKQFNGDPNQITVFSESAGSVMASAIAISPLTPKDLFQRLIIQSASVLVPWAYALDPATYSRDIARRVTPSLVNASLSDLNAAFMKMSVVDLLQATEASYEENIVNGLNHIGGRSLTIGGPSNFLPDTPRNLLAKGQFQKNIDLIAGVVRNEGSYLAANAYKVLNALGLANNPVFLQTALLPTITTALGYPSTEVAAVSSWAASTFFTQQQLQSGSFADMAAGISNYMGTVSMKRPVFDFARKFARWNPRNTYLYAFNYQGEYSVFPTYLPGPGNPVQGGVAHGDDVLYLFPGDPVKSNRADSKVSDEMVDFWTSFAATGVPYEQWPTFQGKYGPYLIINEPLRVGKNFTVEYGAIN